LSFLSQVSDTDTRFADAADAIDDLQFLAYGIAESHGFHGNPEQDHPLVKLALIHAEVSEVLEEVRKKSIPLSEKIDGYTTEEEELADVVIRILDYAGMRQLALGQAVAAKMAYNDSREYKHGKKF
jgi:NTP pyrophosphatase (non-canonical NTP hydrolase)